MSSQDVVEFLKEKNIKNPESFVGPNFSKGPNFCLACQEKCVFCSQMAILAFKGMYICVCFTCPKCGYINHEMMLHSCEKAYANLKTIS